MTAARRLAAIMAVDVVGYSRLMGEDAADTPKLPVGPATCDTVQVLARMLRRPTICLSPVTPSVATPHFALSTGK